MSELNNLRSQFVTSRLKPRKHPFVVAFALMSLAMPMMLLTLVGSHLINERAVRSIEAEVIFTHEVENDICSSWFVRCLESKDYSSGEFKPDVGVNRRLFFQPLIAIDGGAEYIDLDEKRKVTGKSRISSP